MILTQMGEPFARVEIPPLTQYNPCNPSVIYTGGRYLATVRGCNYDLQRGYHFTIGSAPSKTPDSQNYLVILDKDLEIEDYWFIEDRHIRSDPRAIDGIEDLRLFEYQGKKYVMGSALHYTPTPKNTIVICRLDDKGVLREPLFIDSPTGQPVEKNWMPVIDGDRIYFVYRTAPFALYELKAHKLEKVAEAQNEGDYPPDLSGSSCLVRYRDGWLAVIHNKTVDHKKRLHFYRHFLMQFNADMIPIRISRRFTFEEERVEFCSGVAYHDGQFVFSYGLMDQKAVLLKMGEDSVRRLF